MSNYFFIIFLTTIVVTRLFLLIYPMPSPTVGRFRLHHYMYGIIGILFGLLMHQMWLYAIGTGLFIDEAAYLLMRGKSHEDNYSRVSLLGTLLLVIVVFFLKGYLVLPFA